MKKNIILSFATIIAVSTWSYAGGDISPVYEPVVTAEAEEVENDVMPIYVGVGFTRGIYHNSCKSGCEYEDVTYGVMAKAGYNFNQNVGMELRYLQTFWDADELGGQELQHVGLYIKPMMPMNEQLSIYGLVGYGMTSTTTGANGNLKEVDDNGFSAGLGLDYTVASEEGASGWGLFVDYQRLLIKSDVPSMDTVSTGITFGF